MNRFIFALLLALFDVVLRLLIIEKSDAEKWRARPAPPVAVAGPAEAETEPAGRKTSHEEHQARQPVPPAWRAIGRMVKTPRALTSLAMIALFGTSLPTLETHNC